MSVTQPNSPPAGSRQPGSRLLGGLVTLAVVAVAATCLVSALSTASARGHNDSGNDRVSFGNDITVDADEMAGDVACAFCTVHLKGDVHGDVAVAFGSVIVDENRTISGDVAVFGGDVTLADDSTIHGDLALAAGDLHQSPAATIHGDRAVASGRIWLLVPFAPLLILIGIIWLIVWIIRRLRYRGPYYPPVR